MPHTAAGDTVSDENAPVMKVSKRKAEAKIREIAVYEFRPQSYKHKLWYVNDTTLEKLNLSLPVPTEWKWMTLASANSKEVNTAGVAKQSVSVTSGQPSSTTSGGTIKSFISSMTPNRSHQQSPAGNGVNPVKASYSDGKSTSQDLHQTTPVSTTTVESLYSASPVCTAGVCDSGVAHGSQLASESPAQPVSTPRSSSAANKRKVQSVGRRSLLLTKQQQLTLQFSKKPLPLATDKDCTVVDSCIVDVDKAESSADKMCIEPSDNDDDCMIVDSNVANSELGTKSDEDKQHAELHGGMFEGESDVRIISDDKALPDTDANCNLCVETSVNDVNEPVETAGDVHD